MFFDPDFASNINALGEPILPQLGNTNDVLFLQPDYDIGEVRVGNSRTVLVHFKNRTDAPLVTSVECIGHSSFNYSGPSTYTLAAKEDQWIPIRFSPQDTDSHSMAVVLRVPGQPALGTSITGGAVDPPYHPFQPVISGLPTAINFPDTAISGESVIPLILHNDTDTNYQALQLYMVTEDGEFVLDPENPDMPGSTYWIPTDGNLQVNLRFRPVFENRTYSDTLHVRAVGGEGLVFDARIPIVGRSVIH